MSHYKITLQLTEKELILLHNALDFYTESVDEDIKEEVEALYDKVSDLYIEENTEYQLSDAAKAFIDQFGVDEMFENTAKWQAFRDAHNMKYREE